MASENINTQGSLGIRLEKEIWVLDSIPTQERILDHQAMRIAYRIRTWVLIICIVILFLIVGAMIYVAYTQSDFLITNLSTGYVSGAFIGYIISFLIFLSIRSSLNRIIIPKVSGTHEVEVITSIPKGFKKKDIAQVFSNETRESIERAFEYAYRARHAQVTSFHLFLGSAGSTTVRMLFARLGISFDQLLDPLRRHALTLPQGQTMFGEDAQTIVLHAFSNVLADHRQSLTPIEIFIESFKKNDFLKELFYSVDIDEKEVLAVADWMRINEQLHETLKKYRASAMLKPTGAMNRAYTSVSTPYLDQLSIDLTATAVRGGLPLLVGRTAELQDVFRSIEGGGRSVVLVGAPGTGKSALIAGIAQAMVEEEVPLLLKDKRLIELSVPSIISTSNTKPEERLLFALQEAGASGNIVLVVQGIDQLAQAGPSLISILATELEKRYTFMIATSTPAGWRALEQSALISICSPIRINEPSRDEALRILESRIGGIEHAHEVTFTFEAVSACVDLSIRYIHDFYLPEKAVVIAQEVAISARKTMQKPWGFVTKAHVAELISQKTQVPVQEVTQDEKKTLINLEERMHGRVIGQEHAVKAIASALRRARTELRATGRPIANFLFLGPTGVGKTELAKTTAQTFFGNEQAMIRFDMSEYQDITSIARLIGENGQGGLLTEAVRKQPFALLLLDELEKAHPDLLNLFLQVMDDGRLTDGSGRTIDFTNIILIATSNAGTQYVQDQIQAGATIESIKTHLLQTELRTIYRPEFLNRFDDIIVFKPLTQEDVIAITYLMLQEVKDRVETKGIQLIIADEAVHALAKAGYDPQFGARPLRRVIQDKVDNGIADILLQQTVNRRDTIRMLPDGTFSVEKATHL